MMAMTALARACEKLKQQELERRKRKECQSNGKLDSKRKRPKKRRREPLERWEFYLRQRRKLTKRIKKCTGKLPSQMLLNCSALTEKSMLQRLLTQAERLSPENNWRHERLLQTQTKCGLLYTLPAEGVLRKTFTIYGLPEISKTESQSTCCIQKWFMSRAVAQRLEEKKLDIYNLVKHFPDVESLQVVGKPVTIHAMKETIAIGDSPRNKRQKTTPMNDSTQQQDPNQKPQADDPITALQLLQNKNRIPKRQKNLVKP